MRKVRKLMFRSFWLSACSLILGSFASADQNDPKLDDLFSALQASASQGKAAKLEHEIWTRWSSHPTDQRANNEMSVASDLMNAGKLNAAEIIFSRVINRQPNFAEASIKEFDILLLPSPNQARVLPLILPLISSKVKMSDKIWHG